MNAHAIGERAAMRVKTGIEWQQRRMNVDDPAGVALHEVDAEHAHEAGQNDEIRLRGIDCVRKRSVEIFTHVVLAVIDLPSGEDLDRALGGLPIIREMGAGVTTTALPIYDYATFASDLESGVHGP